MSQMLDILFITCNRPSYTELSLSALLASCDDTMRVWIWHNGNDEPALQVIRSHQSHPRFHAFHHCPENLKVRAATNWLMEHADGDLLSVIADDCIVTPGWAQILRAAHADIPTLGVLACWHFQPEDFDEQLAGHKIRTLAGHRILVNPWVQGAGVMFKRACVDEQGCLRDDEHGFTGYCLRLAAAGWINGWYLPLVPIDHMDDPRSPNSMLRCDADLQQWQPLSAQLRNTDTISDWVTHLKRSARIVQEAPTDPRVYFGLRKKMRRLWSHMCGREVLY